MTAAPIDERAVEAQILTQGANRAGLAQALARQKALAVSAERPDALVIGADQTLDFDGVGFNKPRDLAEAAARLLAMAGTAHQLHSGVALARNGTILWSHVESAGLRFRRFSEAELETVLALEGEAILASVGGYRLEGPSVRLFETIEGDYFTILGLPLLPLLAALSQYAPEALQP